MRLPFPERIPLYPVFVFCMVLCLFQQMQGTTALFSACTAAFILLATVAFNVSGGLSRPSGGFIFSYATVGVIFGIVYKVIVGEPGQSNLRQPELTIELYVASIGAMLVAAFLARRFRLKKSYLPAFVSDVEMQRAAVGSLIAGGAITLILLVKTSGPAAGSLFSIVVQLSAFLPLAVLLGVTSEIRRSGGRRSVNATVLATILLLFFDGIHSYSKQGLLSPFIFWLIPAAAQRYKISLLQIVGIAAALSFTVYYLVPYSQYGRNFKMEGASFSENLKTNIILLSNLELVRKVYMQSNEDLYVGEDFYHYYDKPQGLADRTQMISPDDSIINATEQGAVFGIFPTIYSFENLIPHFIWPGKPSISWGNTYAHELGIVADDDITTGISFSPTGDAYHQAKWVGVLVLLPLLSFMLFFIADSVCGDTRASPFALLPLLVYSHLAPEGGMLQFAAESFQGMFQVFLAAFIGAYVMPLVASFLLGPARDRPGADVPIASIPGRFRTPVIEVTAE